MSDFTKYSNYNKNSSFSSVIFGAQSPVLEVELNEMQQIIDTKLSAILLSLGKGVSFIDPTSDANIEVSGGPTGYTIDVYDGIVLSKSHVILFSNFSNSSVIKANQFMYLKIAENDINGSSTVRNEGNTKGNTITNTIIDTRLGVETSRRKVVTFEVCVGNSVPTDGSGYEYVEVLHLDSSNGIHVNLAGEQKVNEQMGGLKFSVDDEGVLCVTYDEQ